eukprot:SAG31_NODE_5064_length_2763_cov_1.885135_2_plen_165_part_00
MPGLVADLEGTHPEAAATMLDAAASMTRMDEQGRVVSGRSGAVHWEKPSENALASAFPGHVHCYKSALAARVHFADTFIHMSQPYCFELPRTIMELVAAEPDGRVAATYRSYVKTTLMPLLRRVSKILNAHSIVIEWPSIEWLAQKVSLKYHGIGLFVVLSSDL